VKEGKQVEFLIIVNQSKKVVFFTYPTISLQFCTLYSIKKMCLGFLNFIMWFCVSNNNKPAIGMVDNKFKVILTNQIDLPKKLSIMVI